MAEHILGQVEVYVTVREVLFQARPQMVYYHASVAVFKGIGMQDQGYTIPNADSQRNF